MLESRRIGRNTGSESEDALASIYGLVQDSYTNLVRESERLNNIKYNLVENKNGHSKIYHSTLIPKLINVYERLIIFEDIKSGIKEVKESLLLYGDESDDVFPTIEEWKKSSNCTYFVEKSEPSRNHPVKGDAVG